MAVNELLKKAMQDLAEKSAYYKQVQKDSVDFLTPEKKNPTQAPATKPVPSAKPVDNRTTAQKVADSQAAYDSYMGSEEKKQNQQAANRKALQETIDRLFAVPGTTMGEMPLVGMPVKGMPVGVASPIPVDRKEQELKATADYYKGQQQAEEDRAVMDADLKEYESWSDEDREQLQKYISSDSKTGNLLVNSNPLLWFGANKSLGDSAKYLYGKYGEEKTKQIASSYSRYLNETEAKKIEEDTKNAVDQGTMSTIGQNILGLGTRLFGGLQATADRFGEALDRDERYLTLAPYTSGDLISLHGNTVTAQTARNIAGEDGGILRQGAAYLYQGGMTMVDSLLRAAAGGGATGGAAIAACNAFSQTVSQASQQGATPEQAYALGAAVAGVEYLSEKIPMDEVFKLAKGGKVNVLKQAFKQTGIEISTEELSLLGSMAAEAAILREKSSYKQQIGDLVANGVSYEEAKAQADRGVWEEVKQTALVSGFAGFLSGGGGAIVGNLTAQPEATVENVQETADAAPVEEAVQPETTSFLDDVAQQLEQEATATAPVELTPGQAAIVNGSQNQPMSMQAAMDSVVATYMPNIPKDQPVQQTEQQRAMQRAADEVMGVQPVEQTAEVAPAQPENAGSKEHISMEDYANNESPVWRNVAYEDDATKASITQQLHDDMVTSGNVVQITESVSKNVDETLPDLRGMKKAERGPILRQAISAIKANLRQYLGGLTNQNFEFEVNGKILDAKLYNTGIKEVLEKVTNEKAKMLYTTEDIFRNARYLYSTPDYDGDPNVYRWNYFYTPVKIGEETVGVRIAVRDMANPQESQVYNWNIKKDAPFGGVGRGKNNRISNDATSSTSNNIITEPGAEVKGTGAAEQNFSGKAEYQDLLYEGNVQRDRQGDVRPMEVPKTDVNGNPVSAVAANVYGSQYTPDDLASEAESAIQRGDLSYIEITNDEAAERANKKIEDAGGWREAYTQWHDEVRDGKTGAEMAARGAMLLNHAAEVYEQTKTTGDEVATKAAKQEWVSILVDVRAMGTNTAQGLQAMRMIRELAPPDKLDFAVASIKRMIADMKLQEEVEIDENLLNEYRMAETDEQRDEIMTEIQQSVADQIPSTFLDKWTALRYMNMLGNLKTNVRNVAGNVGSMVMYRIKDQVATAVERLAGTERTKSSIVGRELLQACKDDFDQVKTTVNSGGKYNERMAASDEFRQGVMDKRQIFKNPVAEGYRKATNWMMNNQYFGDEAFGRVAYGRALAGYLKAKGYDAAAIQNGSIDEKVMNEARAYAIREAQEATFHDNSKLAEMATKMQRAAGVVGQGIMPFTKTPANVLTRAIEFSPIGFIDTAIKQAQRAAGNTRLADKTGAAGEWARAGQDITGADIANSLAKSVTGSVLVGLGYLLKDQGWLTGGPDEDEEKAEFDKLTGKKNWALTRPDGTSYTMDWLTPAAMPMFMGAQLYDVLNADKDFTFSDLSEVFTSIADPMVQMSMLQGLNDTLDGIKYADNNLGQFFINAAVSYLTQGLTNTLLGQLERSTEENRQTTYIDKDSWVPTRIQQALGKASQKIPIWDYQQTDYLNAFGETEKNEGGLLYNLLSPGYLSKETQTALSDELVRLREATGENVFPQTVEKTVSYTDTSGTKHVDHNLTQEELEKMQTAQGQTAAKLLDRIIKTSDYKAMTDQQKAYAIEAVYQYAQEQGKKAALSDYHSEADSWIKEVKEGDISAFISRGASGPLRKAVDNTVAAISNGWKVTGADKKAMNESYSGYTKLSDDAKQRIQEQLDSDVKKFVEIREAGVDTDSYIKAVEGVKALEPEGEYKTVRDGQRWEAALEGGTTTEAKDALVKAYMDDYKPESSSPDKTELKYDYLRQELNRSPEDAIAIMRVQQDGGNKDTKMAEWAALGYTKAECDILWNLLQAGKIDVVSWHNSKTK